jgi:hypothetical protein
MELLRKAVKPPPDADEGIFRLARSGPQGIWLKDRSDRFSLNLANLPPPANLRDRC